ncbi:MAG: hypothetical protein ACJ8C4_04265 [Gemmataceae bacterium]
MLRRAWAIAAVILTSATLWAADPPPAVNPEPVKPVDLKLIHDRIDQLEQSLRRIEDKVSRLVEPPKVVEMKQSPDRVEQLEQSVKRIEEKLSRLVEQNAVAAQREASELRELVSNLRREVSDMTVRSAKEPVVSRKPVETLTGTVMLVNDHPTMIMDALVNGTAYRVMPSTSQAVAAPAGTLSVQVLQTDLMPRARTLLSGETKIITMR